MNKKSVLFIVVPIAVIVLGLIGYCGYLDYGFYEGLLTSLKFLKVEFGGVTNNVFVEIARCLGIIFYFSLLIAILYALFDALKMFLSVRHKDSVAIHGDSSATELCAKTIHGGKRCILSDNKQSFRAPRQIIWFNDDAKSLHFYESNRTLLAKDEVYIALNMIPIEGISEDNVHFFNVNEIIASNYWEKNFVTEKKKIVMIGTGALAEEMLEQGLLMNVFSKEAGIEYHVIGDFKTYLAMHPYLQEAVALTKDELTFDDTAWYLQMEIIKSADRIVLTGSAEENVEMARRLINYGIKADIHLMAETDDNLILFTDNTKDQEVELNYDVLIYGTLKEVIGEDGEMIFQDEIHRSGKTLDAVYGVLSGIIDLKEDDEKKKEKEILSNIYSKSVNELIEDRAPVWSEWSIFVKKSNYTAARHSVVKRVILKNVLIDYKSKTKYEDFISSGLRGAIDFWYAPENRKIIEKLEEIEHLRWWRLYLLNNFTYNENVKKEDKWILRQNANMKEYNLLDETTKRYDGMLYWLLAYDENSSS